MLEASTPTPNTIILKGDLERRYEEGRAGGTIKPGHQIEQGSAGTFVVHGTAGGVGPFAIAIEDALQGKTIDDAYSSGDLLRYFIPQPGDLVYVYLKAGESVVKGDKAISGGDGTQIKATGTILKYNGRFEEALDLSGGGAVATRVRVRVA